MSLASRAVHTATILRTEVIDGMSGDPTTHLTKLKCTNLFPASSSGQGIAGELVEQGVIKSITHIYETALLGNHDIRPGDVLRVSGQSYTIHAAAAWQAPGGDGYFMYLTVEKTLQ